MDLLRRLCFYLSFARAALLLTCVILAKTFSLKLHRLAVCLRRETEESDTMTSCVGGTTTCTW